MITYKSQKQLKLEGFETPFEAKLDANNRWVKLSQNIPWDELARGYYRNLSSTQGRPAKDARLVIGAVIIKHKLCLSDEETVLQIQENFYLQYFVGFPAYQDKQPFSPSLFVEIRRRMGEETFVYFQQAIVNAMEKRVSTVLGEDEARRDHKDDEPLRQGRTASAGDEAMVVQEDAAPGVDEAPIHQGRLILDATVAEQAIRFPTDLSLLNEGREISEQIIDVLHALLGRKTKPRTYRQTARKDYLAIVKQRRASRRVLRKGIRQQLQYLRRNIQHIEQLLDAFPERAIPLSYFLLRRYWIIQHLYNQQEAMYRLKCQRCDHRIVSIHQPHVRPIVRGKANKVAEFGAKLSVSLTGSGIASVDHIRWDAFHEGGDLPTQVETYKQRYGYYPQSVLGDTIYGTRDNRHYLKEKGIHFAGKPLGRPPKITEDNRAQFKQLQKQRREDYRQRIPIEGKFGQGKNGYNLNYIRAKTARTSEAWINSIFLVMNLMVLLKAFICLCTSTSYKYHQSILGYCLNIFQCLKQRSAYSHNV
jgi:hypothetical protein